ncbi:MAG TPA: CrcB family protein [Kofleriaceae bacterium]|nr:CrcB family protein [Kofleriaceae bacterium]
MKPFLCAVLGSAAGGGVRYLVGLWAARRISGGFPYGTLIVNLVGCFLMAFVMYVAMNVAGFSANLRIALTTGFMGGLTTYSAFNYETSTLLDGGAARTAMINVGVTLAGCFVLGLLGLALARRIVG